MGGSSGQCIRQYAMQRGAVEMQLERSAAGRKCDQPACTAQPTNAFQHCPPSCHCPPLQIGERLAFEAQFLRKSLDPLPKQQQLDNRE